MNRFQIVLVEARSPKKRHPRIPSHHDFFSLPTSGGRYGVGIPTHEVMATKGADVCWNSFWKISGSPDVFFCLFWLLVCFLVG